MHRRPGNGSVRLGSAEAEAVQPGTSYRRKFGNASRDLSPRVIPYTTLRVPGIVTTISWSRTSMWVLHPVDFDATDFYTIHPNARALWLAAFQARA